MNRFSTYLFFIISFLLVYGFYNRDPIQAFAQQFYFPTASEARDKLFTRVSGVDLIYAKEAEPIRQAIDEAAINFIGGSYSDAARIFYVAGEQIQDTANKRTLDKLVTASLFGAGEHRTGLRFICEKYRNFSSSDHRFRHDIHAHLRSLAYKEGIAEAVSELQRFKSEQKYQDCSSRADFTPLWIGIPIEVMWGLLGNERYTLADFSPRDEDAEFLRSMIANDRPFADYAKYALSEFEQILESEDFSYIRDMALFSAGIKEQRDSNNDKAKEYYERYLIEYPRGPNIQEVVGRLVEHYNSNGQFEEVEKLRLNFGENGVPSRNSLAWQFITDYAKQEGLIEEFHGLQWTEFLEHLSELTNLLKTNFDSENGTQINGESPIDYLLPLYEPINNMNIILEDFEENEVFELAIAMKACGDSREYFSSIPSSSSETAKEIECTTLIDGMSILGHVSFHNTSISLFTEIISQSDDEDLIAKSIYLASIAAKRNDQFDAMQQILSDIETVPESHYLKDDLFLERGWLNMIIFKDFRAAENDFLGIVERFPNRNAYDNALNWLTISKVEQGDFAKSVYWSKELALNIVSERLTRVTAGRASKIDDVLATTDQKEFVGINFANYWDSFNFWGNDGGSDGIFVDWVDEDSKAYELGFRKGQIFRFVGEIPINSVTDLVLTLSTLEQNQMIFFRNYDNTSINITRNQIYSK